MTAEPGQWHNDRTPYLRGMMDVLTEDGVEIVTFLKAVQVGFSECARNMVGYWVDQDPGPAMFVMPSQQAAEEMMEERIRPLLGETPKLAEHVSDNRADNKLSAVKLDTMTLYMGWSGSPQALASRPIRYIVFDEVDKYPPFTGKEADPISLGLKRLTTYGTRARAFIGSTPTTRVGNVWQQWEACTDQRHFYVPCPDCGHEQRLSWERVKWPKRLDGEDRQVQAERVESSGEVRYGCEACESEWTETQKNAAVRLGEWRGTEGASKRRVGFHLNSIYSPFVTMAKLAGEWLRAQGDMSLLMDFRNSRLAEPFEQQSARVKPDMIAEKRKLAGPPMVVPDWASLLILTVDVQVDRLYYVLRAWGHGYRSQAVRYGMVPGFDDLWPLLTEVYACGERRVHVAGCAIDARYRTDEVYQFALRDPSRIWPVMGDGNPKAAPIRQKAIKGYPGVIARTVNPNYWKSRLQSLIQDDDETRWLPHNAADEDYCRHMGNEHLVLDPKKGELVWRPVSSGARVDYWDCEYHQTWAAQELGAAQLPTPEQIKQQVNRTTERQRSDRREPVGAGGGWATGHKGRY